MANNADVPDRIGNWILEETLGSGYSGSIWRAVNPFTGQVAALKVQDVDHECPTNRYERFFYPSLQGGKGMPTLWASGVEGTLDYLVIDLLGPSLDNLYRKNGRIMDLRSTICIAMQVISRLEFMHHRGILHRDIQLGNCVIGLEPHARTIYMIDFGFSKRYIDAQTRKHIPDSRAKRDFIGNYWFSSVNVHCRGKVPSRRDDMEALALMLIHLVTPNGLPWTRNGIPKDDEQHDRIVFEKLNARPDDLCYGLPSVFEEFLRYCRRLKFLDQPNYKFWRDQFAQLAKERGYFESDGRVSDDFIWPPRPEKNILLSPQRHNLAPAIRQNKGDTDIENLLGDLKNLNLDGRQNTLGRNNYLPDAQQTESTKDTRTGDTREKLAVAQSQDIIEISSGDESVPTSNSQKPHLDRLTKATLINGLTRRVQKAVNNKEISDLVHRFVDVMQSNSSKVITKDAFDFLFALNKQLDDPSVFMVLSNSQDPRLGRDSSGTVDSQTRLRSRPPAATKGETVKVLRQQIASAPQGMSNTQLAKLIIAFISAVRSTSAKALTKDGTAFLLEVEARLKSSCRS